jgi:hypothetical protein
MAAFVYNRMCAHGIYDHVVDLVSKKVHRALFADALGEIRALYDPFERLFTDGDMVSASPMSYVKELYPEAKSFSDSDSERDWLIILLKLNSKRFVLYHEMEECGESERVLMIGEYTSGAFAIDRFAHVANQVLLADLVSINEFPKDSEPFQFMVKVMAPGMDYGKVSFADSSDSPRGWAVPSRVMKWFTRNERAIRSDPDAN